jgi:hypothetical protein
MILSYIQDWKITQHDDITKNAESKLMGETEVSHATGKSIINESRRIENQPNPDTEHNIINPDSSNSFEEKYLQFKDRIDKDRMAWEILANRNK